MHGCTFPSLAIRLDELDPNTFETRAAELLHGLGFPKHMMDRKTKDMSGKGEDCVLMQAQVAMDIKSVDHLH